jgi:hypothetical protein
MLALPDGPFGKQDFVYLPEEDTYRCPSRGACHIALRARRTASGYGTTGPQSVKMVRLYRSARQGQSGGFHAGSMSICPRCAGTAASLSVSGLSMVATPGNSLRNELRAAKSCRVKAPTASSDRDLSGCFWTSASATSIPKNLGSPRTLAVAAIASVVILLSGGPTARNASTV